MGIELGGNKTKECDENVSCMNYRCQDGNKDDQIVINGCGVAKKEQKCHKSFHKFCERALIGSKVSRMIKDDCTTCYGQKCNVNTELITQPKPGSGAFV
ncbi:hypothetical protein niasHT_001966 [Heterodera trifolii]|uniref:Uncharacterized protein n=1 Tax=Heterodera trifolii TaxID=157864 RepID=A0ABD2M365_9BILA